MAVLSTSLSLKKATPATMEKAAAVPPGPISYAAMLKNSSPAPAAPVTPPPSPSPSTSTPSSPLSSTPSTSLSPLASEFTPSSSPSPQPSPQADPSTPGEDIVAIPGDDILATPDDNDVAKEPHWACPGKLAWLEIGMIGPSSVIRQRLTCQERVDGFENHPVLVWRAPDEDGIVQVIPITSYGGQRAEQKWGKMREGPMKQAKLQQLLMLENGWERPHCGTEVLPFTKPFSCRKRSYLHIEHGIFNLEVDCLTPYTVRNDSDIVLADSAMHYITMQLCRYVHPCLWMGKEDAVVQVPTAFSAKDLTKLWRCS